MDVDTDFRVFDREIPVELVEPLIEHLCMLIAKASFSLYGDEVLALALSEISTDFDF